MFLVKTEESRNFDVFFVYILVEKFVGKGGKIPKTNAQTTPKNPIFQFWSNLGCQGLFIALGTLSKARRTFKGHWVDPAAQQSASG